MEPPNEAARTEESPFYVLNALQLVGPLIHSHPSFAHLHFLLKTLLQPTKAARLWVHEANNVIREYKDVIEVSVLGFPCDWGTSQAAARAFVAHREGFESVIEYCVEHHVAQRRAALRGEDLLASDKATEVTEYLDTLRGLALFLAHGDRAAFGVPDDWPKEACERASHLLYRGLSLFLLRNLFHRLPPDGGRRPMVPKKRVHAYYFLGPVKEAMGEPVEFGLDDAGAEPLIADHHSFLKRTEEGLLHDIMSDFDYPRRGAKGSQLPPHSAVSMLMEDMKELSAFHESAGTTSMPPETGPRNVLVPKVTEALLVFSIADLIRLRSKFNHPKAAQLFRKRASLFSVPSRSSDDIVERFRQFFAAFQNELGIASISVLHYPSATDEDETASIGGRVVYSRGLELRLLRSGESSSAEALSSSAKKKAPSRRVLIETFHALCAEDFESIEAEHDHVSCPALRPEASLFTFSTLQQKRKTPSSPLSSSQTSAAKSATAATRKLLPQDGHAATTCNERSIADWTQSTFGTVSTGELLLSTYAAEELACAWENFRLRIDYATLQRTADLLMSSSSSMGEVESEHRHHNYPSSCEDDDNDNERQQQEELVAAEADAARRDDAVKLLAALIDAIPRDIADLVSSKATERTWLQMPHHAMASVLCAWASLVDGLVRWLERQGNQAEEQVTTLLMEAGGLAQRGSGGGGGSDLLGEEASLSMSQAGAAAAASAQPSDLYMSATAAFRGGPSESIPDFGALPSVPSFVAAPSPPDEPLALVRLVGSIKRCGRSMWIQGAVKHLSMSVTASAKRALTANISLSQRLQDGSGQQPAAPPVEALKLCVLIVVQTIEDAVEELRSIGGAGAADFGQLPAVLADIFPAGLALRSLMEHALGLLRQRLSRMAKLTNRHVAGPLRRLRADIMKQKEAATGADGANLLLMRSLRVFLATLEGEEGELAALVMAEACLAEACI